MYGSLVAGASPLDTMKVPLLVSEGATALLLDAAVSICLGRVGKNRGGVDGGGERGGGWVDFTLKVFDEYARRGA